MVYLKYTERKSIERGYNIKIFKPDYEIKIMDYILPHNINIVLFKNNFILHRIIDNMPYVYEFFYIESENDSIY